jgi:hypothetical protein
MRWRQFTSRGAWSLGPRRTAQLRIAPLRLRLLAVVINTAMMISALAALILAGARVHRIVRRFRPPRAEPPCDPQRAVRLSHLDTPSTREHPLAARLQSRPLMLAFALASFASAVRREGSHGPAARLLGLRLVDMQTGKPISRRQAVVRVSARRGWQVIVERLAPRPVIRTAQENREVRAQLDVARRQYGDDEQAFNAEALRIYRDRKTSPVRSSGVPIFVRLMLMLAADLPALWSPLGQGIPDRLAGTVHVVEPPRALVGRLGSRFS